MFTYAVINSQGDISIIEEPTPISYDDMVAWVDGYIECVLLDGAVAYVNEEGKLEGLRMNWKATEVAHAHNAIYGDDYIAGNMLIVGNSDDEGEMTSLTTEWINANLKEIANV
jgi:hypothetical protein